MLGMAKMPRITHSVSISMKLSAYGTAGSLIVSLREPTRPKSSSLAQNSLKSGQIAMAHVSSPAENAKPTGGDSTSRLIAAHLYGLEDVCSYRKSPMRDGVD
jgi:hypothetical protein